MTAAAPAHAAAAAALERLAGQGPVAITRQILREYVAVVTRPQSWAAPMPLSQALGQAEVLSHRFRVFEDGQEVWAQLRILARTYNFGGKQVHDANIVATMRAHGETRLLTFNAKDFRRFEPLIEIITP